MPAKARDLRGRRDAPKRDRIRLPFPQPKYRGAVGTTSPLTKKWYVVDKINCRQTPIRLPSRNRWWVLIPQPTFLFAPFFPAPCRRWKPNRSAGVLETKGGSTEPVPTIDTTAPIMSIRHRLASIVDRELEKMERGEIDQLSTQHNDMLHQLASLSVSSSASVSLSESER